MKLRTGRHNHQLVYVQHGDSPADTDPMFAVCFDTDSAALIVDTFNGTGEAFELPGADLADEVERLQLLLEHAEQYARDLQDGGEVSEHTMGRVGAFIANNIRAELVCCDVYDRDAGTDRAGTRHAICFWGEAAARIAEGRDDDEPTEASDAQ